MNPSMDAQNGTAVIVADKVSAAEVSAAEVSAAEVSAAPESLTDSDLLAALDAGFAARRLLDADLIALTAVIVDRSRPSLGRGGLATRLGQTGPAAVLASTGLIGLAEARVLCRLAEATTPAVSLLGERLPARYPVLAGALTAGTVSVEAANWIVINLNQATLNQAALNGATANAEHENLVAAEVILTRFATEHPADTVRKLAIAWRDALDTDGIQPRDDYLVSQRTMLRRVLPNGMKLFTLKLDPLSAATIDAYLDGYVGNVIRAPRFTTGTSPDGCDEEHNELDPHGAGTGTGTGTAELTDPRTLSQIAADAMVELAQHGISCPNTMSPMPSTTVVVRMSLESLLTGLGAAIIDGADHPISAGTARRLAADAHLIPAVLGSASEILDLGKSTRLFGKAHRLAFAERDGGCAVTDCTRPPSYTEAHHIQWWSNDGPTNLNNGILLCSKHHHSIHQGGWEVKVTDNVPWFIPPSSIDIYRKPRPGGNPPTPELPTPRLTAKDRLPGE